MKLPPIIWFGFPLSAFIIPLVLKEGFSIYFIPFFSPAIASLYMLWQRRQRGCISSLTQLLMWQYLLMWTLFIIGGVSPQFVLNYAYLVLPVWIGDGYSAISWLIFSIPVLLVFIVISHVIRSASFSSRDIGLRLVGFYVGLTVYMYSIEILSYSEYSIIIPLLIIHTPVFLLLFYFFRQFSWGYIFGSLTAFTLIASTGPLLGLLNMLGLFDI